MREAGISSLRVIPAKHGAGFAFHTSPSRGGPTTPWRRRGGGRSSDAGRLTPPGLDLAVFAALPVKGRDEKLRALSFRTIRQGSKEEAKDCGPPPLAFD
jgi:hypothetical protein